MSERKPVIVVTGGASGMGDAIATLFADTHTVIVADIKGAEEKAKTLGHGAVGLTVDIGNEESCRQLVETVDGLGGADALVNCAGIFPGRNVRLEDMGLDIWEQIMKVNLTGTFIVVKAMAKSMRPGSSIVLIGSRVAREGTTMGDVALPTNGHYCASKAGVSSLVKSFAMELGVRNIRVNGIAPGPILTPMTPPEKAASLPAQVPLKCWGTPLDIAQATRFLCSEDASFITGHMLDVNGGRSMY